MNESVIPILAFGTFYALAMGVCWKYARRRLSEKEMVAWRWRSEHAVGCWVRFVFATFVLMTVLAIIIFTPIEMSGGAAVETVALRMLRFDPLVLMLIISAVIGSIVFGFWYWNGVALYRGRLLEEALASANDPRASSRLT